MKYEASGVARHLTADLPNVFLESDSMLRYSQIPVNDPLEGFQTNHCQ